MSKIRVVGLTFVDGYPDNLYALAAIMEQETAVSVRSADTWADLDKPTPEGPTVILVRNPANEHDANAIEVHVVALGRNGMVGHIPAKLAAQLAPKFDAGQVAQGHVTAIAIHPDHLDNPGLEIEVLIHAADCPVSGGHPCACTPR